MGSRIRRSGFLQGLRVGFFVCAVAATLFTLLEIAAQPAQAIPAFARKYGLPCSACHTAWPELNNFGQVFRDNGYQLYNGTDSPIYQNPSYFPITFRITPNWHSEKTNNQPIDIVPGNPGAGQSSGTVSTNGFDLSGIDIWAAGTLYKDISFSVLPSSDSSASFHFENAFVRFDNLLKSHWLNLKAGKFELDNLISEKRFLFLSNNGGLYQTYHFVPPGDSNTFGLGNNALGAELLGHSDNSYTRYSVALLSGNDGNTGLSAGRNYDAYFTASQAFEAGKLGLWRFQGYLYVGQRPTFQLTSSGTPIPGTGIGNKSFYRAGFAGNWNVGILHILPFYMHGSDSAYLGTGTPANMPLPVGARAPTWNGGFVETHEHVSPQFAFVQRYELIRMSQQALPTNPSNLGDIDAYSVGLRWYPIMFSRAGLAVHSEYSITKTQGSLPQSGDAVGVFDANAPVWSSSVLIGLDFAF